MTGSDEKPWGPITTMTFDLATDDGTERLGEVNLSDMPTRINAYFGMGQQSWTDAQGRQPLKLPGILGAGYVRADIADDMLAALKEIHHSYAGHAKAISRAAIDKAEGKA